MPKKEGEETEQFGQKITTDPEPEPEVEAPTAEQQLEALQAQVKAETEAREKAEKSEQGLRGSLKEKDTKLREQADSDSKFEALNERIEFLATAMALGKSEEDMANVPSETIQSVKAELKQMRANEETKRKETLAKSRQEEYGTQARATYAKAKEVYPDDDVKLLRIERFLDQGMLDDAEALIAKAEGKATDTKENKVESEDEKFQKAVEKKALEVLQEKYPNLLESETGGPSAASQTDEKVTKAYLDKPNDPKAYADMVAMYNRKGGRL